jgi:sigma-B regulation protein RsbU (phosphoserine phosphatase)
MSARPGPSRPARILVVDDNEMNRDMLSRRLARRGYDVQCAEGGQEALDRLGAEPFDLVLLDIMMPGVDGMEVLERVRAEHAPGDLPIIMATARDESTDIVSALKLGANDYVTKPLDFPVVLARVQTQLALKEATDAVRAAHQRMKRDLEAAARVQQALLPAADLEGDTVSFSWMYKPCDELAGDSLNFVRVDERRVAIYIIDVSGHGVPAALLSVAVTHNLSRSGRVARRDGGDAELHPAAIATHLNDLFPMAENANRYFTMVYGILDTVDRSLTYVCAGHPGPLLVRPGGEATFLDHPGLPVGVLPEPEYENVTVQLEPGDRVYFYSDGLNEEMNPAGEMFGRDGIRDTIAGSRAEALDAGITALASKLAEWRGNDHFSDDLTIVGMELRAS